VPKKWWEREKIHFECQEGCLKCCLKPGVIYFDKADVKNATEFLGCEQEVFVNEYLKKEGKHWELEVEDDQPCPFLTMEGCAIHEAKPKQCRTYPFWKENLRTRNHWKLTAGFCPGIHEGPVIPSEDIRRQLKEFDL